MAGIFEDRLFKDRLIRGKLEPNRLGSVLLGRLNRSETRNIIFIICDCFFVNQGWKRTREVLKCEFSFVRCRHKQSSRERLTTLIDCTLALAKTDVFRDDKRLRLNKAFSSLIKHLRRSFKGIIQIVIDVCSFSNAISAFSDFTLTDVIAAATMIVCMNKQLLCGIQVREDHFHRQHRTMLHAANTCCLCKSTRIQILNFINNHYSKWVLWLCFFKSIFLFHAELFVIKHDVPGLLMLMLVHLCRPDWNNCWIGFYKIWYTCERILKDETDWL